uniref:dihydrofolate reductase n=1 Tax=Burkholderia phage vB_BgluM-SURPRISE13 TaxID=3159457 RepID=A0AAU7PFS2_9VIRU
MKLILIAAEAANKVIGNDGKMPWHIPEDLQMFKDATVGSAVIMGRKTWESIGSKALPARTNVVVSKTLGPLDHAHSVRSFKTAVKSLIAAEYETAFVIGGETLYRAAMPWASRIILTKLYKSYEGDAHFPDINPLEWVEFSKNDYIHASQPFTVHRYAAVNQPDVAKWVDLIKD